ncbi:MAG: hypothetical protein OXR68_03135 [Alphaproteobacteria bacterium]|nr:hypothetical protein [Alphaproteobacteria bacterium]MDD9919599.1 hypothetical protein [Alphaproteobacteria bacterium]
MKKILSILLVLLITVIFGWYLLQPAPNKPLAFEPAQEDTTILTFMHQLSIDLEYLPFLTQRAVDLDHDGANEYILFLKHEDYCGMAGCMHAIFKKYDSAWQLLNVLFGTEMYISKDIRNGFNLIAIDDIELVWQGQSYQELPRK